MLTLGIIGLLVLITLNLDFLNPVVKVSESFSMTDIYYRIQHSGERKENKQITLVDMGELTIKDREQIGHIVAKISELEPSALGVDVIFQKYSDNPEADDALAEAFFHAPENTVLAFELSKPDRNQNTFTSSVHSFFADDTGISEGTVNVVNNPMRSMTVYPVYFIQDRDTLFSLPVQLARQMGAEIPDEQNITINYRDTDFPVVKWNELDEKRHLISNRIVLLGATDDEADMHLTPLGKLSGMEIVAYSLLSVIEGENKKTAPFFIYILWAILAGWVTNVIDLLFTMKLERKKNIVVLFLLRSELYARMVSFTILVLFTYISFILFTRFDYDLSSVLALTTSVLIGEGRTLYIAFLSVLKRKGVNLWKNSLYAEKI